MYKKKKKINLSNFILKNKILKRNGSVLGTAKRRGGVFFQVLPPITLAGAQIGFGLKTQNKENKNLISQKPISNSMNSAVDLKIVIDDDDVSSFFHLFIFLPEFAFFLFIINY